METKLARISQLSSENPGMVFTSVGHLINRELLKECHRHYAEIGIVQTIPKLKLCRNFL